MAFPFLNYGDIYLSSGYVKYNAELQFLEWYHWKDPSIIVENSRSSHPGGVVTETLILKNHSGSLEDTNDFGEKGHSLVIWDVPLHRFRRTIQIHLKTQWIFFSCSLLTSFQFIFQ